MKIGIERNKKGQFLKGWRSPDNCECLVCKKKFHTKPSRITIGKGKFCSKKCKYKFQTGWWKNNKNPRWNNGIYTKDGYRFISDKENPLADCRGYVREHRAVLQSKMDRTLKKDEIVHHINKNKMDNRPENLELITNQSEHIKKYHYKQGKFI